MSYPPPLAAALSGASLSQLAYWRKRHNGDPPLLVPEQSQGARVLYSYNDLVALRMFVALREQTSLQRIRKAVRWLHDNHADTHLSAHRLATAPRGRTIVWISQDGEYVDIVEQPGQQGIRVVMDDIFDAYTTASGRRVPRLVQPAAGLAIDEAVRGGFPVIEGTRIPFDVIAGLRRDGMHLTEIRELYPAVSEASVNGAARFAEDVEAVSHAQAG